MEILKVITHSHGGSNYINNGINYLFDERCVMSHGYGINPYDANIAAMQFKQNAKFWNNQNKNPFLHCMISFSQETAPTANDAMRLTDKIIESLTEDHFALSGVHNEKRAGSLHHTHNFISTTNFNDGSMIYADNATNYALAQRTADITGQPVTLVVKTEGGEEWECPQIFTPQNDEEEE